MTSPTWRGAALLIAAMVCFSGSDALAKQLSGDLPPVVLAWCRYVGLLATVVPFVRRAGAWRAARPALQGLRAAALIGSALLFLFALRVLPVAEATAMVFASPMFVTLFAVVFLKEPAPPARWLPVAIGFAGVLVVVRPGHGAFGWAALLPIASSIAWAASVVATRKLAASETSESLMMWPALLGVAGLGLALPAVEWQQLGQHAPRLLGMLACWSCAQWLTLAAYRAAAAASIAPFAYTQLLFACVLGWLVFGHVPDATSLAGIAIILGSGLLAAWQGRRG